MEQIYYNFLAGLAGFGGFGVLESACWGGALAELKLAGFCRVLHTGYCRDLLAKPL